MRTDRFYKLCDRCGERIPGQEDPFGDTAPCQCDFFGRMPVITLTNTLRIGNFSSPHSFEFVDGSVLPACSNERCKALEAVAKEVEIPQEPHGVRITSLKLSFELGDNVRGELVRLRYRQDVDIVLLPLPILQAWNRMVEVDPTLNPGGDYMRALFRTIRVADRISKKIHIDRFCL